MVIAFSGLSTFLSAVVNDNMRGLVLSSAACEAGQRPGQAAADRLSKWFVRIIKLRDNSQSMRCFSEDAVGVELPSVIRQLESFFRSFLGILDLT